MSAPELTPCFRSRALFKGRRFSAWHENRSPSAMAFGLVTFGLLALVACPKTNQAKSSAVCANGATPIGQAAADGRRVCAPTAGPRPSPTLTYRAQGPIGPVNAISPDRICLGFAGGPSPPYPVNECHNMATSVHVGVGVDVGAYVEIRLDSSGRVIWIELYRGLPPG